MTAPETFPSAHQLRINDPDTPQAAWVVGAEELGIGFIAEGTLRVTTAEPDRHVAQWAAECLEVSGVVFVAVPEKPRVWSVEYV